jgi:hypothetical protein
MSAHYIVYRYTVTRTIEAARARPIGGLFGLERAGGVRNSALVPDELGDLPQPPGETDPRVATLRPVEQWKVVLGYEILFLQVVVQAPQPPTELADEPGRLLGGRELWRLGIEEITFGITVLKQEDASGHEVGPVGEETMAMSDCVFLVSRP